MTQSEAIQKILTAKSIVEIFPNGDWKSVFRELSLLVHPDVCKELNAKEAFERINAWKQEKENGITIRDDSGKLTYFDNEIIFKGDQKALQKSLDNWKKLYSLTDKASLNFRKYLPDHFYKYDNVYIAKISNRAIPLVNLTLTQEHVNWILSRMLEFSAWLHQSGFSHNGINPESIFIVPETHGIICVSFYHLTKLHSGLSTISAKYRTFYPANVFDNKIAASNIDIELSKRTAIYVLGDKSGNGIMLKKTHNEDFMDFVIKQHYHSYPAFKEYRDLLSKNFPKKFYLLNL